MIAIIISNHDCIAIAEHASGGRNLRYRRQCEHRQLPNFVKHSTICEYLLKLTQTFYGLLPWPPWCCHIRKLTRACPVWQGEVSLWRAIQTFSHLLPWPPWMIAIMITGKAVC